MWSRIFNHAVYSRTSSVVAPMFTLFRKYQGVPATPPEMYPRVEFFTRYPEWRGYIRAYMLIQTLTFVRMSRTVNWTFFFLLISQKWKKSVMCYFFSISYLNWSYNYPVLLGMVWTLTGTVHIMCKIRFQGTNVEKQNWTSYVRLHVSMLPSWYSCIYGYRRRKHLQKYQCVAPEYC